MMQPEMRCWSHVLSKTGPSISAGEILVLPQTPLNVRLFEDITAGPSKRGKLHAVVQLQPTGGADFLATYTLDVDLITRWDGPFPLERCVPQ